MPWLRRARWPAWGFASYDPAYDADGRGLAAIGRLMAATVQALR